MKNTFISIIIFSSLIGKIQAQNVSISGSNTAPDASAVLDLQASDKGLLVPRLANPSTIVSPATGLMVYNTTTNRFNYFDGAVWIEIGSGTVTGVSGTLPISVAGTNTPVVSITNAAADGTTKGAASFTANDFDATSGNISIDYTNAQKATTSQPGFLTNTDWNTFNNKLGTALTSGNIFVGNSSNVATASSLTLNATGGTFALSNAGVLTFPNATTSIRGLLTSADWTTFNGKENVLTFSSPLIRTVNTISLGTIGVGNGGTGATTLTGMLRGNGTGAVTGQTGTQWGAAFWSDANTISTTAVGISGQILRSNGAAAPTWSDPTGIVTVENGLTETAPATIRLGGALTQLTTISALTATNKMSFTGTGVDAFNVDGTTLSVDATNDRVGIGLTDPVHKLTVEGNIHARGFLVVQDGVDGGNTRGIRMWTPADANWGIYMGQSGALKSFSGGTATAGGGFTQHAIRFRVASSATQGFIFENSAEQSLLSIRGNNGRATFRGGVQFDCVGCGSTSTIDGDQDWGTMTLQGRVISANANIHLSPPNGSNVIINAGYRAAGGSTGTAGLVVEGNTKVTQTTFTRALAVTDYVSQSVNNGSSSWSDNNCPDGWAVIDVSVYAGGQLQGPIRVICTNLSGIISGGTYRPGNSTNGLDNNTHVFDCNSNEIARGFGLYKSSTGEFDNGNLFCSSLAAGYTRGAAFDALGNSGNGTGPDNQNHGSTCPPGSYVVGSSIYASGRLDGDLRLRCATISQN
jgi:hypothetical protein